MPGHTSNISILKLYAALSGLEDTESNMNGCTFVEARKRLMQRSLLRPWVGEGLETKVQDGQLCAKNSRNQNDADGEKISMFRFESGM